MCCYNYQYLESYINIIPHVYTTAYMYVCILWYYMYTDTVQHIHTYARIYYNV